MARPKTKFTKEQLAWVDEHKDFVTVSQIARYLDIPNETARNHFGESVKKRLLERNLKLQKAMWDQAIAGNATLCIWLSKQYLNMTDDGVIDRDELTGDVEFGDV